ncbi:MarR family winged helix-turn-helix transcriptional regulator [Cupriavidus agavae]|uniref:DNA-binding MarR family transcriptional regulator n=1 Tax=Cupriavidus agavae TaxID=1001822 RepID=A0A4V2FET0_9BURK|nr:MarR family transcriptional regulator [Cupriavidus agavae]RZT30849.1 DNA-binding MarR family transcriptional regulator [Cupriavidus agavae]
MKHYTRENFQPTQSVGFHLNRARNSLLMEMDAALRPLDITGQQMGILMSLKSGSVGTPLEISRALSIDTGLMTRMLDKLENKGLLQRHRSDEDRRVVHLILTDKGRTVACNIPEIAPQVLNHRLRHFSSDELRELLRLLQKFADGE